MPNEFMWDHGDGRSSYITHCASHCSFIHSFIYSRQNVSTSNRHRTTSSTVYARGPRFAPPPGTTTDTRTSMSEDEHGDKDEDDSVTVTETLTGVVYLNRIIMIILPFIDNRLRFTIH